MRLIGWIGAAGGLTPPEAESGFEVERRTWARIGRLLFRRLTDRREDRCVLPAHLRGGVERAAARRGLRRGPVEGPPSGAADRIASREASRRRPGRSEGPGGGVS